MGKVEFYAGVHGSAPTKAAARKAFVKAGLAVFVAVAAAAFPGAAWASSDADFQVTVSDDRPYVGDTFMLTMTITSSGDEIKDLQWPDVSRFDKGEVSKSQSTSIQIVNGGIRQVQTLIVALPLAARTAGRYTIGEASVRIGNQLFRSQPFVINVLDADPNDPAARPQGPPGQGMGQNPGSDPDPVDPFGLFNARPTDSRVTVRAIPDKTEAYVGEQITLSLQVLSRDDVSELLKFRFPRMDGFWMEDVYAPKHLRPATQTVGNEVFNSYLFRKVALFGTRPGPLNIEPITMQLSLLNRSGFFSRPVTVERASPMVQVTIKPLPAQGRPADFNDANVGQFYLQAELKKDRIRGDEPVQLTVSLDGQGNFKQVEIPKLPESEDFKVYDPTVTATERINKHMYGGTRKAEYLLVPKRSGSLQVPAITFHYFDPARDRYQTIRTPVFTVMVEGPVSASGVSPPRGAAPQAQTGGFQPIVFSAAVRPPLPPAYEWTWFWPLLAGMPGVFVVVEIMARARGAWNRASPGAARRKALNQARKHLQQTAKLAASGDRAKFYSEAAKAVHEYLSMLAGRPTAGLTSVDLRGVLEQAALPAAVIDSVLAELEHCDYARFAPDAAGGDGTGASMERLNRLAAELEKWPGGGPAGAAA